MTNEIEQHATRDDALAVHLVDSAVECAETGHRVRREAIVELVIVINMSERIPLGGCLQRHDDHVVVETKWIVLKVLPKFPRTRVRGPVRPVARQRVHISAVHRHHMDRVVPKLERPLGTRRAEVHP